MSPPDTIPDDYRVEPATWPADEQDLRAVRERVFLVEQAILPEDEWDDQDAPSRHVLARDAQGRAIGTGRLTPSAMIGRIAVLPEWRGRGVGKAIMRVPPPTSGRVLLEGVDLSTLSSDEMRVARGQLQMIFQDAISSLNPRRRIRDVVAEPLVIRWLEGQQRSFWVRAASPWTESSFIPRFSTVSIIPGIDSRAPDRTETNSGSTTSPSRLPVKRSSPANDSATSCARPAGNWRPPSM
jgi:GNAT superfamily N-acetyltransferase